MVSETIPELAWSLTLEHPQMGTTEVALSAPNLQAAVLVGIAIVEMRMPGFKMIGVQRGKPDAYDIPEHMANGLLKYIFLGLRTGDFLRSVICNDMFRAAGRADYGNRRRLWDYSCVLHNCCPTDSYGNEASYDAWVAHQGLAGLPKSDRREWAAKFQRYAEIVVPEEMIVAVPREKSEEEK